MEEHGAVPTVTAANSIRHRKKPKAFIKWKPAGVVVVDVDVHIYDGPEELAPYADMPWRKSLEHAATFPHRYNDLPGYAPRVDLYPSFPGAFAKDYADSPSELRSDLDLLSIDHGVIFTNHLLPMATLPDPVYARALVQAYNRWLLDRWLGREPNLWGAIMAHPHEPEVAAREVEKYAREKHVIGVALPIAGIEPLLGHPMYDPLLQTVEACGLPLMLHSAAIPYPAFPFNTHKMVNAMAAQTIGHGFSVMANISNLVSAGVPAKFPKLKFVFMESGISWMPYIQQRLDRLWTERRRDAPQLDRKPSEYFGNFYVATQPIEEPDDFADVAKMIDLYRGWNTTVFASDWPHHDFDHPKVIWKLPVSEEKKKRVMGENAMQLFGISAGDRVCPPVPAAKGS